MKKLRIGTLARLSQVSIQTLRYYERRGLLPRADRRLSGYREYAHETIGLVRIIKHLQGLGFSLREIKKVMALGQRPSATFEDATCELQRKIDEIDAKIEELRVVRKSLAKMLDSHRPIGATPFAPHFRQHVAHLASEAIALDSAPPR